MQRQRRKREDEDRRVCREGTWRDGKGAGGRLQDRMQGGKEMPPNNLRKPVAKFTDFIRFTLNKMRRLFSGSS